MSKPGKNVSDTFKVVISSRYGCYSLSKESCEYIKLKAVEYGFMTREEADKKYNKYYHDRTDPLVIEAVEILGSKANGSLAKLKIEQVPSIYKDSYEIAEYDGSEDIVCDIYKVVVNKVKNFNTDVSSSEDCRIFIEDMKKLIEIYDC